MTTRRGYRHIRVDFCRNFRRPLKIRVEAKPLLLVDRIAPPFPAGTFLRLTRPPASPPRPQLRVIRLEPTTQPDWRIVGDHELMVREEGEASCL